MGRLWSSGCELNSLSAEFINVQSTPTVQSTTVRSGTYALQINSLVSATVKAAGHSFLSAAGAGPYYFRTYFRYATLPTADNRFIRLSNTGTGTTVAGVAITSTGGLKLMNGNPGTQVGSTTSSLSANTWYRIEIKFDRTGGAGASTLEMSLDGSVVATSSVETLTNIIIAFGVGGNLISEAQTTGNWFFDDMAINDSSGSAQNSYPGSGSIIHQRPAGAGDSTGWTISGSSPAATNWQSVSEVTPDDGITTVQATTAVTDFYTVGTSALGAADTVNLVALGVRNSAISTTGSSTQIKLEIKKISAGTIAQGSILQLGVTSFATNATSGATSPHNYSLTAYNDPDGGAWTKTTIESMQIGQIISTAGTLGHVISTIWALVEYVPAAGGAVTAAPTHMMMGMGA